MFFKSRSSEKKSLVAIHDAVRPLVSIATIESCFDLALEKGNAIPVISPPESVREELHGHSRPLSRDTIKLVQTPQVFESDLLLEAYSVPFNPDFTDDASVIEANGTIINLIPGNQENIKITTPQDLIFAEAVLRTN